MLCRLLCVLHCWFLVSALAIGQESAKLPKALVDWQDWVLSDEDYRQCPFIYNREEFSCTWVSSTHLQTTSKQLAFQLKVRTYAPRWVSLPGSPKHWPQNVVDENSGKRLAIREQNKRPQVFLDQGEYSLRGKIDWQSIPNSIDIPSNSGIIHLRVDGELVAQPELDNAGELWLRQENPSSKKLQRNTETIQVFRKIEDGNPLKLVTRVVMDISGEAREILTGPFLLNNFIPLVLNSPLPARVEKDGKLRVQVKPGRWIIELKARHLGPLEAIEYSQSSSLWPNFELWVFQADHSFRRIQIDGAPGIDPSQTMLPKEWQSLPAYRVLADTPMKLQEIHRGDPSPEADELTLQKALYLDFDGKAFTVSDELRGKIGRSWRFDSHPDYVLGSASLNGMPQLITESGDGESQGLEIRQGSIDINAVSRLAQSSEIPISGWLADFKSVSARLHLPPGWSLLATAGIDEVENSWISRWNLWDMFLVLIIVVAVFRLCGIPAAVLAMLALVVLYHRSDAPLIIWLNLVAVMALLKVTEGKLNAYLGIYQTLSFVVLLFILLPFSVAQIRQAVYPQLEERQLSYGGSEIYGMSNSQRQMAGAPETEIMEDVQEEELVVTGMRASRRNQEVDDSYSALSSVPNVQRQKVKKFSSAKQAYDPNAIVQTGPGVPNWKWHDINLSWSGPVAQGESLSLYLAPPWLNRLGSLVAVLLAALFAFVIWIHSHIRESMDNFSNARNLATNLICVVFAGGLLFNSETVKADVIINEEILEDLHEYLTQPPKCLPDCASIEKVNITAKDKNIRIEITAGSMDELAFGLPAWRSTWLPKKVSLNSEPATIKYGQGGQIFIRLPKGRHNIVMEGLLLTEQVELRFDMPVHNFSSELQGWDISGVHEAFVKSGTVQLQRLNKASQNEDVLLPDPIPPFVIVYRRFDFAMEWSLVTTVKRVAPQRGAISLQVPLFEGESPMSDIPVKDGKATVVLGVNQSSFQWRSSLKKSDMLKLLATEQENWTELWAFEASPIWHVEYEGIAPNKQSSGNLHTPLWAPWPGEMVNISISRPQAVEGQNLTIDELSLVHSLGQRSHNTKMTLDVRTSRGQNFPFTLPEGAVFDSISINGKNQPLISSKEKIDIPLRPGQQTIDIHWHDEKGIESLSSFPNLELGVNASNIRMVMNVPSDRWLLLVGGPLLGPAVLYWGILIVVLLAAFFLGKSDLTPLRFHHWALLGIGVTSTNIYTPLIIVAWLFAIGWRGRFSADISDRRFRAMQVGLIFLSIVALVSLIVTIPMGLLSSPDMHIVGNGSYSKHLVWFQDRISGVLPDAWLFSLPLYVYRIVMLLWSLWLAVFLLNWLKWGWEQLHVKKFW